MREKFNAIIGYSDHAKDSTASIVSVGLGAKIIEKHFTLDRSLKGTDHPMSLAPSGLRKLIKDLKKTEKALGNGVKSFQSGEKAPIKKMAKKIVASKIIKKGTVIESNHLEFKSPGDGLPPYLIYELIGKKLSRDVDYEHTFELSDFL